MGGIAVPDVEQDVDVVQDLGVCLHLIEGEKLHVEGSAGQGLDDPGVGVVLLLVQGVMDHVTAPGAGLSAAV